MTETMQRFTQEDYARFIGQHFILEVTASKNPARNGIYALRILPGNPDNKVCPQFRAELHQTLESGNKAPIIVFPPVQGERHDHRDGKFLRQDADVFEVASISSMMKMSMLGSPMTPAVTFKLAEKLAEMTPPESPAAPAFTGHYGVFDSDCEGDDWSAKPYKLPDDWPVLHHRQLMKHITASIPFDDREMLEDQHDKIIFVVDAKVASIINIVISNVIGGDIACTQAHDTAVKIAKQHHITKVMP